MAVQVEYDVPSSLIHGRRGQLSGPYYKGSSTMIQEDRRTRRFRGDPTHKGPLLLCRNCNEDVLVSKYLNWTQTVNGIPRGDLRATRVQGQAATVQAQAEHRNRRHHNLDYRQNRSTHEQSPHEQTRGMPETAHAAIWVNGQKIYIP